VKERVIGKTVSGSSTTLIPATEACNLTEPVLTGTQELYVKKGKNLTEPVPTGTHKLYVRKSRNLKEPVTMGTLELYAKKGITK
jgi:hypothetical protein